MIRMLLQLRYALHAPLPYPKKFINEQQRSVYDDPNLAEQYRPRPDWSVVKSRNWKVHHLTSVQGKYPPLRSRSSVDMGRGAQTGAQNRRPDHVVGLSHVLCLGNGSCKHTPGSDG
jgi:hypothetical protein